MNLLTEREREILSLIALGLSNLAIGHALCLSPKTVETHVRSVFDKLGLERSSRSHRRVEAVLAYRAATALDERALRRAAA